MADSYAPPVSESTASTVSALAQNLPALMQAYSKEIGPTDSAKLASAQNISPAYSKLMSELYQQFAPSLAKTGAEIDSSNRTASAKTDANLLAGPGTDIARQTSAIDKEVNPEYYKTRSAEAGKLGELLSSINLNAPNIEAERQISQENARSGNLATPSATNTTANALQFGEAQRSRQAALGSAINAATNFLQPSSNPAPVAAANSVLAKPPSNTGLSNFGGVTQAGNEAFSSGQGLLNSATGLQSDAMNINANRRDLLDRANSVASIAASAA